MSGKIGLLLKFKADSTGVIVDAVVGVAVGVFIVSSLSSFW